MRTDKEMIELLDKIIAILEISNVTLLEMMGIIAGIARVTFNSIDNKEHRELVRAKIVATINESTKDYEEV